MNETKKNEYLEMLSLVKNDPNHYKIVVGDDSVWIDRLAMGDWVHYWDFDEYGEDFIIMLFGLLGYRVDGL